MCEKFFIIYSYLTSSFKRLDDTRVKKVIIIIIIVIIIIIIIIIIVRKDLDEKDSSKPI